MAAEKKPIFLRVPPALHHRARIYGAFMDTSVNQLLCDLLDNYLADDGPGGMRLALAMARWEKEHGPGSAAARAAALGTEP